MNNGKIFFAVFIAALLLGCAGGQQPAPQAQAPATTAPATTTPGATEPAASTPSEPAASAPAAQGTSFDSITANAANLQYKADYTTTSNSGGQTSTFESTVVVKGSNMRTDMTAAGMQTSTYLLNRVAYMCTIAEQTTCLTISMQQPGVAAEAATDPSKYTITPKPPRTIAGVIASCFAMSGAGIEGTYESCYSAEGVPLYMAASDGSFVQEATSVQLGNVADSEFTLPATPIDVSAYAAGYGS